MQIQNNRVVHFHYNLIADTDKVVESTRSGEPVAYLHGHRNIVPGLEEALAGREAGEHFRTTLAPEAAYGLWDEDKVYDVERALFTDFGPLSLGMLCQLTDETGEQELVKVINFDQTRVTVDANPPYAGQTLTFEVEVTAVREATAEEIAKGSLI